MMPQTFPWIELPCLQYEQKVPVGSSYVKLNKIIYQTNVIRHLQINQKKTKESRVVPKNICFALM